MNIDKDTYLIHANVYKHDYKVWCK